MPVLLGSYKDYNNYDKIRGAQIAGALIVSTLPLRGCVAPVVKWEHVLEGQPP